MEIWPFLVLAHNDGCNRHDGSVEGTAAVAVLFIGARAPLGGREGLGRGESS